MRRLAVLAALPAALLAALAAAAPAGTPADPAPGVSGRWITPGRDGVFRIDRCGAGLCGWLVGMRYDGSMPLDVYHRPQCGLMLLSGFRPADAAGRWHGSILDPDSGRSYQATIWSPAPNVLKLRGYLLLPILGQTQDWRRYDGSIGPACKLPPG